MCRSLSSSSSMIHRDSWSISSRSSESVARLYSNRDIALRGPDLCSSVMWLRYDPWPHFFFLRSRRSTRILSALGERGAGKRKRRELSRGWIAFSKRLGVELDRKSADRFVSRAILSPRTSGRRNFCRRRRGEWFSICTPFEMEDENDSVGMSDSMLKFFQREDCIWGIDRNLIIYKL